MRSFLFYCFIGVSFSEFRDKLETVSSKCKIEHTIKANQHPIINYAEGSPNIPFWDFEFNRDAPDEIINVNIYFKGESHFVAELRSNTDSKTVVTTSEYLDLKLNFNNFSFHSYGLR